MIIDLKNTIANASLDDWDKLNLSNRDWNIPQVFNELVNLENHSELYSKGLYIHIQKNTENRCVYDNNVIPKVVNISNTYMIKWGKFNDGILKRRKLDFSDHYHYKAPNFPEAVDIAVRFRPYVRLPVNPRPIVDDRFRTGSSSTLLHLVSTKLDPDYEQQLGELIKNIYNSIGEHITKERINIPLNSVDEEQLLVDIRVLFEMFERNSV